jgi:hypothetical protein
VARIRTIKPEFPQSESMGRVSREARLTFVLLWTLADDAGRLRGNSRMLASLLFPYDDDAPGLIDGWLSELVREECVTRYLADGGAYVQINNWLDHQKIDKPSGSKIPAFDESSRTFANPLERSSEDLRTKDQGSKDQGGDHAPPAPAPELAAAVEEWNQTAEELHLPRAELLTDKRQRHLRKRLASCGGIEGWRVMLAKIRGSPGLQGVDGGWKANFDFVISESGFTKIMEGQYDGWGTGTKAKPSNLDNGFAKLAAGTRG